jgi:hypothetical protein
MAYVAVAGIAVSIGTTLLGAGRAKKEAQKQRDLMLLVEQAKIASNEKIMYEQIRTGNETQRLGIFADNTRKYREALQKESTIRLRDTWIYIAGIGCGTGVIYGVYLMASKGKPNA